MPPRIALYTFGIFIESADHPVNDGFYDRNDPIFEAVENAPGFIARSGYADEPGPESWGRQVYPRFYEELGDEWSPSTLSLWGDMESAMAFSYFGLHASALRRGSEWFRQLDWPSYVAWWVTENHVPDWQEAIERHEYLHDNGSTAFAFKFKRPFNAKGAPVAIDQDRLQKFGAERDENGQA